jgi:CDP-glucose 4,6-dehydratase
MVKNFYKNKKILVTGATGFKGAWLCQWLLLLGAEVNGFGFNPNKNKNLFYSLKLHKEINLNILDIRNYEKLKKLINRIKPEIIFHLAAQPLIIESYKKPYETYQVNTFGTINLLESLKTSRFVKSIVLVTSDKCYENNFSKIGFKEEDKLGGEDPYSGSKACAEILANTYYKSFFSKKNVGVATARAGNVIGGGDWSKNRLIPDCINSLINNKIIHLRNPYFNRPWQHVMEPLNGYLILAEKLYKVPKKFSGSWNFGSKKNTVTDVHTIVKRIIKTWGFGNVKFKKKKYYEQKNLQLNINKSQKILKWSPKLSINQGVDLTVDWYKQVLGKKENATNITINQIKNFMSNT